MLEIKDLSLTLEKKPILHPIDLSIEMGSVVALLGPSGSGKSTILRCLARLERRHQGALFFKGTLLETLPAQAIGMVFQSFHLFSHLNILDNLILAPTRVLNMKTQDALDRAQNLLAEFGIEEHRKSFPHQLSGGQKQRVAIARALMLDPEILLFDEPTSALDPELVSEIGHLIQKLKRPDRIFIIATHEMRLARDVASQVVFLDKGRVIECADANTFFTNPSTQRAQDFISHFA